MSDSAYFVLPVSVCGTNRIAEEHTLDVHDELTGACRSVSQGGISCGCPFFRDSGRRVKVPRT